jgi:hypothetical protein
MGGVIRLVGNDTIKINERLITDLPDGEVGSVKFATDIATVKTGKNKNAVIASNASGEQATMELRVLRGSADDKYLNGLVSLFKSDPPSFALMNGEVIKRVGDGEGAVAGDTYVLTGGVPTKNVDVVSNVAGDVEQGVSKYTFNFVEGVRAIA